MHLNVLIKDTDNIHRLYNIYKTDIPVQLSDKETINRFVETLLNLRVKIFKPFYIYIS